ncbi:MAG: glycosyltransferase family 2 protein [Rhizobiaceae bacterium]|nr:glycosyltransferase family 2 protein [Rhizobiaceae bacterium]
MAAEGGRAADPAGARVAVLLGTKNGGSFLEEQLRSVAEQHHPNIDVWASDDGSSDDTLPMLRRWADHWSKGAFVVLRGPDEGFAENFRALLTNATIEADYFAFCDQDDIWERHKLATALTRMAKIDASVPQLYCSRTLSISEDGRPLGHSPLPLREPSFRNALVQSLAGGNTMVLNRSARDLVARASMRARFVSHDWWSYQIVSASGGVVHYDAEPMVRYRQHAGNQIGANSTWAARIVRLRRLFAGQFYDWTDINMAALEANRDLLTEESRAVMDAFRQVRDGGLANRFSQLRRSRVYRQSIYGNLGLYLAVAFRRI